MTSVNFSGTNYGNYVGVNNGSISFPAPERPETPPNPLSTVPFRRDPDFVDRGTLLDQIHEKASTPGARVALVGLGGVGKSQLAIELCHQVHERFPDTWVIWIHASNAARFEQSCWEIADRVKISGRKKQKANIFKLLAEWLHDTKKKWILIFDNLDEDKFLHDIPPSQDESLEGETPAQAQPVWAYFSSLQGPIVITSRTKGVASSIVEDDNIITIDPMSEIHALALFEKKLGKQVPACREHVVDLITALEFMPLAIVQAAVYIKKRAPRLSVEQYLENFQQSDRQKISLLGDSYRAGQLRRDWEAKSSIFLTLRISFDYIQEERSSAVELLSFMSFFDRQGIPEFLLQQVKERHIRREDRPGNDEAQSNNVFEDDVLLLREYSLISISADDMTFGMHRMVQIATHEWLRANTKFDIWRNFFIHTLHGNFPEGKFENWPRCQLMFAHVLRAELQKPEGETLSGEWVPLLREAALFAWSRGNLIDSTRLAEKAVATDKELFGQKHEETLTSLSTLGLAYALAGRWKEAEDIELEVLEGRKETLGLENPLTLVSMANLSGIYQDQGRWQEAETLQLQNVETRERLLGPEDFLNKAEELGLSTLQACMKVMGPKHPQTLITMSNLASTYWTQGRWKEAEKLQVQILESRKDIPGLGPEHPDTLVTMNDLALSYRMQERWKEARDLQSEVFDASKKALGPTHPDTLTNMNNLAHGIRSTGDHDAGIQLMADCVMLCEQSLGVDHPDTLHSKNTLKGWYEIRDQKTSSPTTAQSAAQEPRRQPASTETPDQSMITNPGRRRKREILSRLLVRKKPLGNDM